MIAASYCGEVAMATLLIKAGADVRASCRVRGGPCAMRHSLLEHPLRALYDGGLGTVFGRHANLQHASLWAACVRVVAAVHECFLSAVQALVVLLYCGSSCPGGFIMPTAGWRYRPPLCFSARVREGGETRCLPRAAVPLPSTTQCHWVHACDCVRLSHVAGTLISSRC